MHIVFIHLNTCEHLALAMAQAKTSFPQATVTLLGNKAVHEHMKQRVGTATAFDFVDLDELGSEQLTTFQAVYQHFSGNDYYFERFCFDRWIYLKTWMAKHDIAECVYLDSDVLLYPSAFPRLFSPGKASASFSLVVADLLPGDIRWSASGHVSRWSKATLEQFCEFLIRSYQDEAIIQRYAEKRRLHRLANSTKGVSDMTSLYFFQLERQDVDNLFHVKDNCVFDDSMNSSHAVQPYEYKMKHGAKLVTFVEGTPHLTLLSNPPAVVPAGALHFQGVSKFRMREYYRGPKLRYPFFKTLAKNSKVQFKRAVDLVWPGSRHDMKVLRKEVLECKELLKQLAEQIARANGQDNK